MVTRATTGVEHRVVPLDYLEVDGVVVPGDHIARLSWELTTARADPPAEGSAVVRGALDYRIHATGDCDLLLEILQRCMGNPWCRVVDSHSGERHRFRAVVESVEITDFPATLVEGWIVAIGGVDVDDVPRRADD